MIGHAEWQVVFYSEFKREFGEMPYVVQNQIAVYAELLREDGPMLGRPAVGSLSGSKHSNMKELRFKADRGVWRVAFAFDPTRRAVVLVAGNKRGVNQRRFYLDLIALADERFDAHLRSLENKGA